MNDEVDDFSSIDSFDDRFILNDAYFLHKTIDRALSALSHGIHSNKFNDGMVCKNLEVDQAVNISVALGLFEKSELEKFLEGFDFGSGEELIVNTKKSNMKLAFLIKKIKDKKPLLVKGII